MDIIETFIAKFHNLDGLTQGAKKRCLFELLDQNSNLSSELLDNLFLRLSANTHLERIFRVDCLIYYRRFHELHQEYLKGTDIVVNKVSTQKWFFQKAFHEIEGCYVTDVLPSVSYSVRLKLLNKMPSILNEAQSDSVFDALQTTYGLYTATILLTSCSVDKITQVLHQYSIQLWTSQLKRLYLKSPELIYIYIEQHVQHIGGSAWLGSNPIIKYIAVHNPTMYLNLQAKYKFHAKLGKRTTKRIVQGHKNAVITHADLHVQTLHKGSLVRSLGPDFQQFFMKIYPRKTEEVSHFYSDFYQLLQYYPKHGQFTLFRHAFDALFSQKLEQRPELITQRVLELIHDNNERGKWAKLRQGSDENLKYLLSDECMSIVKARFNSSSPIEVRVFNIGAMTETCVINKDWTGLLSVCELLCTRFKNDDKRIHVKFLQIISSRNVPLQEVHWTYIKKILSRHEFKVRGHFQPTTLLVNYAEHLFRANKEFEDEFLELVQASCWVDGIIYDLNYAEYPVEFIQKFLGTLINLLPKLITEREKSIRADLKLLVNCCKYKLPVRQEQRLVTSTKTALEDPDLIDDKNLVGTAAELLICVKNPDEGTKHLTELYWNNFTKIGKMSVLKWFLKNDPMAVSQHLDQVLKSVIEANFLDYWESLSWYNKLWQMIKTCDGISLDKQVIEWCLQNLNHESTVDKTRLFKPLSVVMDHKDFCTLGQAYKPDFQIGQVEKQSLFQMHRNLLKCFTRSEHPELALALILEFCEGDYVGSTLSGLYSCLSRVPGDKLGTCLAKLCRRGPVSVRKHGFYFSCVAETEMAVAGHLQDCELSQGVAMAYQHFVKNQSAVSWGLLLEKIPRLDKNDVFTSMVLVNTPAPTKYKSRYFTAAYPVFKKQGNKFTHVLIDKLKHDTIADLETDFFNSIGPDFLVMKKSDQLFASHLIYSRKESKFDLTVSVLNDYKTKCWSFRSQECRQKLSKFIDLIFDYYLEKDDSDEGLVRRFRSLFEAVFSPVQTFQENVTIFLMMLKNTPISHWGKEIVTLNGKLMAIYGKSVIPILADCLRGKLDKMCKNDEEKMQFLKEVFEQQVDVGDVLLVIFLLPKSAPELRACVTIYQELVGQMKEIKHDAVQVQLNLLLKNKGD